MVAKNKYEAFRIKLETKQSKTKSLIISGIMGHEILGSFSHLPWHFFFFNVFMEEESLTIVNE